MKSAKRLSFMFNELNMLPEYLAECPAASTLLLQGNRSLEHIPDKFLQALTSLKVLDLSDCGIKSLPIALARLVELQALILAHGKCLQEIPLVGGLAKLQVLNCRSTNIEALPEGMERLTNLRQLDLSQIRSSTSIKVGAISRLSSLEILSMSRNTGKWFIEGKPKEGSTLLEEILSLERLVDFDIVLEALPCNISHADAIFNGIKKLKKFRSYIGSIKHHSVFLGDDSKRLVILSCIHFRKNGLDGCFLTRVFCNWCVVKG